MVQTGTLVSNQMLKWLYSAFWGFSMEVFIESFGTLGHFFQDHEVITKFTLILSTDGS